MSPKTLTQKLQSVLSPQEIVVDVAPFQLDQRRRYHSPNTVVVQPNNVESVQRLVQFCATEHICITPQGGNTGLVGGSSASNGIIINTSKLNHIRKIHLPDNAITVEAGCILHDVQTAAQNAGRFFPLSLASEGSCQIGGNIACNAGGLNVVRYGTMRDLVLGLEVVLPDGSLLSHLTPLHKNTTAYELKHLFIGSEGTLGIITAATLKMFAPPQTTETAWIGVNSIEEAVNLLMLIQNRFAERLTSFELISHFALELSSHFSHIPAPIDASWHVLLELTDSLPMPELSDLLAHTLWDNGYPNSIIAQSEQHRCDLWTLREHISAAQKGLGTSIKHDIAMPIAAISTFIHRCADALQQAFPDIRIVVFGHLGDGSLHYNTFLPNILDDEIYLKEQTINQIVYQEVLAQQGTIAAEHGIGILKKHWLSHVRTPNELALMRDIKTRLDPNNIFNPNKLFS